MALTRAFLKGLGLSEEQQEAIIEGHNESLSGIKAERDTYKEQTKEIDTLKAENEKLKAAGTTSSEWEEKYNAEHKAFEDFKAEKTAAETKAKQTDAFKALLKEVGIADTCIDAVVKVSDVSGIEFDENGAIKGADALKETVKTEWSGFVTKKETEGAGTQNPPGNDGASAFQNMSLAEKMQFANEHPDNAEVVAWLK